MQGVNQSYTQSTSIWISAVWPFFFYLQETHAHTGKPSVAKQSWARAAEMLSLKKSDTKKTVTVIKVTAHNLVGSNKPQQSHFGLISHQTWSCHISEQHATTYNRSICSHRSAAQISLTHPTLRVQKCCFACKSIGRTAYCRHIQCDCAMSTQRPKAKHLFIQGQSN